MKKVLTIALTLLITPTAFATTLQYMSWDSSQLKTEKPIIEAFEKQYGVKVKTVSMPPKDYWPRLSALAASGDLPDVFQMSSGFVQSWQEDGQIADLSGLATDADLAPIFDGALSPARLSGGLYALPQSWVAPLLYYNKDAFDKAGLSYPNENWQWADFLNAAKKLTVDTNNDGKIDQYGLYFFGRYAHIEPWIYRNNGRLLNADRTRLAPDANAIATMKFLNSLMNEYKVAARPKDLAGVSNVFANGLAAMWIEGSWQIDGNRKNVKDFKWGISQIPMGPNATKQTALGYAWSDMISMSPTSENKDLAWKLMKALAGIGAESSNLLGGKVPAVKSLANSPKWLEADKEPYGKKPLLDIGAGKTTTSFTKKWGAWRGYGAAKSGGMTAELDEAFNGNKSIDDAIKAFVAYGNGVLSK